MTSKELRKKYLEFFASKRHAVIPSAPLVPANDPTVLFTTAGMHPLVPYLIGEKHPAGRRLASVQKCIRTGDIDEVGDDTHLTFFEMLGNWSLGDYFKEDAIPWSFEFLTSKEWLGLPLERLAFSCFAGDADAPRDETSFALWLSRGVKKERIAFLGKEDNWWGPAGETGPCGPDTEMFYWIDEASPAPQNFQDTHTDPRWVEIWNDVFMEYNKTADGSFEPLAQKNVDTGMGLERTLAALGGKRSVYEADTLARVVEALRGHVHIPPAASSQGGDGRDRKLRIMADHIRAAFFIIADGVEPSNKDRGYVLRRILRRSMVYARQFGMKQDWYLSAYQAVDTIMAEAYPEISGNRERIEGAIHDEAQKFGKTLEKGLKEFEKLKEVDGKIAFDLYQTYGFPWELTKDLAEQKGQAIDKGQFEAEFKKHQDLSRTSSAGQFKGGLADHSEKTVRLHTATHLMNKALRQVLGEHVWQKGSHINPERTRFDFTHPEKMTPEQIQNVEALVNGWIGRDLAVKKEIMPLQEARKLNAIGAFGEKYGQTVSVYTVHDPKTNEIISREFCGGPHVEHAGSIGKFKIIKEEAIAAGVRRIKAIVE
ncbi:MAG: alanine--tRNA ligase [bacterium]|nr:alanine--tRNA ligase [bacterium]